MLKPVSMGSIDELRAVIEKLETLAIDVESDAREMFRLTSLKDTSCGDPTPFPEFEWIKPTNDVWKRLQRDVVSKYQKWYSTALQYVKVYIPDRSEEFNRFYGDKAAARGFHGVIDALQLNINEYDGKATEIVDKYMGWFGRQRDLLLSIPGIVEAQENLTVASNPIDLIHDLCERFHLVARQLRSRHNNRDTLDVQDEYDVQDLFHAILHLHFEDIRPEEWTPSFAGASSRMDFLLKPEQIVIEIKKTRQGLGAKEVGSQLIGDIERYQTHPDCRVLICFVYDPEGKIANTREE